MEYENSIETTLMIIASNWEYKFNTNMTDEDFKNFRQECKDAGVTPLDVYPYMSDYENI